MTEHDQRLMVRKKSVRQAVKRFSARMDFGRVRPKRCFEIIGLKPEQYTPITSQSFEIARKIWIMSARLARESGDTDLERAVNIAWQHLKNWRCPLCGGVKSRTRTATCGAVCGRRYGAKAIRRQRGPIILQFDPKSGAKTGRNYQGNGLRRAQFDMLKRTLEACDGCVAEAARRLGMNYGTIKYYIRKFKAGA